MKTAQEQRGFPNVVHLADELGGLWTLLVEKGYQGAGEFIRIIKPRKKPIRGTQSSEEIRRNEKVLSDRILDKKCFGRLCTLWGMISGKYRWEERSYDTFFRVC